MGNRVEVSAQKNEKHFPRFFFYYEKFENFENLKINKINTGLYPPTKFSLFPPSRFI